METYNLGKIEALRDLKTEMVTAGIAGTPAQSFRGFVRVSGENIQEAEVILHNLEFRIPTIKECVYLYDTFKSIGVGNFSNRTFWVDTEMGAQILLITDSHLSIWANHTETLSYTLFAVRDI
jgi:hypothetical protein